MARLVYTVGINDLKGDKTRPNGTDCPIYSKWSQMLQRCYSEPYLKNRPTYRGCTVCEEWKTFSNFMAWLTKQKNWEKFEVDKDILVPGNKHYSPETCVLVSHDLNHALAHFNRGCGVWKRKSGRWSCDFRHEGKRVNLGTFADREVAVQKFIDYKTKNFKDKIKNLTEDETSDLEKTKQGLLRHIEAKYFLNEST